MPLPKNVYSKPSKSSAPGGTYILNFLNIDPLVGFLDLNIVSNSSSRDLVSVSFASCTFFLTPRSVNILSTAATFLGASSAKNKSL